MSPATVTEPYLPLAVTQLMKGVVYRDDHEQGVAQPIAATGPGARLRCRDRAAGRSSTRPKATRSCASAPTTTQATEGGPALPRLIPRRSVWSFEPAGHDCLLTGDAGQLEAASAELQRLDRELKKVKGQITSAETEKRETTERIGGLISKIESARWALEAAGRVLTEPECEAARPVFAQIAALMQAPSLVRLGINEPADCDGAAVAVRDELTSRIDGLRKRQVTLSNRIVAKMGEFRRQYHVETSELDDSLASAAGYREPYARLVEDDLPRFQHQFKRYLNQNTIRDIAGFQSQLNKQAELIRDRVEVINESLVDVDYNPGRFIRLEAQPTQDTDIRDFRTDLRACTDDAVSGDASDQYSEQKFLQVSRIIERFKGREGQTESDRTWARRVTDVRNWFVSPRPTLARGQPRARALRRFRR